MELKKVTKREARKAFDAKQTIVIVTVDSVGHRTRQISIKRL